MDIATRIGKANEEMIRTCDIVLGVLDGAELDSGTVSEIGFGAGIGKTCYGCAPISATAETLRNSPPYSCKRSIIHFLHSRESSGMSMTAFLLPAGADFIMARKHSARKCAEMGSTWATLAQIVLESSDTALAAFGILHQTPLAQEIRFNFNRWAARTNELPGFIMAQRN